MTTNYRVIQKGKLNMFRVEREQLVGWFKRHFSNQMLEWVAVGDYHCYYDGGCSEVPKEFASYPEACFYISQLQAKARKAEEFKAARWEPSIPC